MLQFDLQFNKLISRKNDRLSHRKVSLVCSGIILSWLLNDSGLLHEIGQFFVKWELFLDRLIADQMHGNTLDDLRICKGYLFNHNSSK